MPCGARWSQPMPPPMSSAPMPSSTKRFARTTCTRRCYHEIKGRFQLTAQVVVRLLAKVGDSYRLDRHTQRTFRPRGSIAYDSRILTYDLARQTVSIWTVNGRETIPFVAGERQKRLLVHQHGESDLVYRNGQFYLLATCDVADPDPIDVDGALGIDLGIVNLAVDSDGETYSGEQVERARRRYSRRRAALQAVGTKSAKRRLKRISGQQRRFQTATNHVIAKRIVAKAERTKRAVGLEDLKHIRSRSRARGPEQRQPGTLWVQQLGLWAIAFVCDVQGTAGRCTRDRYRCGLHQPTLHGLWAHRACQPSKSGRVLLCRLCAFGSRRLQCRAEYRMGRCQSAYGGTGTTRSRKPPALAGGY